MIEKRARRLEEMGHAFVAYPKDGDPQIQAERCRNAERLKFIDVAFTGADHVPVAEAKRRGIAISDASGYATQAVAELCISFMIQLLRNVGKAEKRCRNGGTKDGLVGNLLWGKAVGIVGAGTIGRQMASLCKAFGCRVLAYSRSDVSDAAIDKQTSLEELLAKADVVFENLYF